MVVLLPQVVRGLVVLGVVVVVTGPAVLHVPPHPLHPLLGRAGQDRFSKHRHLVRGGVLEGGCHVCHVCHVCRVIYD